MDAMDQDLDQHADMLVAKIKHYLITAMGRVLDEANLDEIYRALCYALREEVMIRWLASSRTHAKKNVRMLYYFSMEYLPGRILSNNITNLESNDVVRLVLNKLNKNLADIITRETDPALGNGGLGRLASCFMDSLATHHYPAQGYGLRYQYGTFEQQLWEGVQIEAPDCWLLGENPWEFRRDLRKVTIKYCGHTNPTTNIHGDEILTLQDFEEVWALPFDVPIIGYAVNSIYSVCTLRLWTTKESPRNFQLQRFNAGHLDQAAENTTLTDVLYPSDHHEIGKRIRLKQEYLLVSASLQDIIRHYLSSHDNFRTFADKIRIQINDTHPALAIPELIRLLTQTHDLPWKMAVDITLACTSYTNHTILSEALEQWDQNLFYYLLPRQYKIIERLNYEFCNSIRTKYPQDEPKIQRMSIIENGKVRMANLSIVGSHNVNGVAALHTEILKSTVFKDFHDAFPSKFLNITNGVTQRRWLLHCNPDLAKFIIKSIGTGWITDFNQISQLAQRASEVSMQEEFLQIKRKNKHRLIEYINQNNKIRNSVGEIVFPPPIIDVNSLFDVQIKRIHEYKRQIMNILHLIMVYFEILENPKESQRIKRTSIIGGKAAAGYETAKDTLRLIHCVARKVNRDPSINGLLKIVLIENYNVSKAEVIIPAADLSEQISLAGMEASGTGNMKLAMNGALTIGTNDGANIEMREAVTDRWWPFAFGCSAAEIAKIKTESSYNPRDIYNNNPRIRRAIDTLRDRTFATSEAEHQVFSDLFHKLIEGHYGGPPDRFFSLKDLDDYYNTQKRVETLFQEPGKWAECAIQNIAGMAKFSTDFSIKNYSEKIWDITPCPPDDEIFERVKHEYSVVD
jgi:glycogen phosphorylase